jgi:hypothetical protein
MGHNKTERPVAGFFEIGNCRQQRSDGRPRIAAVLGKDFVHAFGQQIFIVRRRGSLLACLHFPVKMFV